MLAEPLFRRLVRNASWLFSANVAIGLIGLLTLALTARALGPAGIGLLALVEAYVKIVDRLFRLEPWQAVLRYGIEAQQAEDDVRFCGLFRLSIAIDIFGGVLAGTVAMAAAWYIAPYLGLPPDGHQYIWLVALGMFVSLRPTGLSALRIFDRFDLLAKIDVFGALLRLGLTGLAYMAGFGIWAFLAVLLVHRLFDGALPFLAGLRVLNDNGHANLRPGGLRQTLAENPGFLRFLWNSNFNVMLRQSVQRIDIILLSIFVTPVQVGYFHIAKRSADAAIRFGRPISQAIFPEIARLWADGQYARFRKVVLTVTGFLFVIGLIVFVPVAIKIEPIVTAVFGAEFLGAVNIVLLQGFAALVYLGGIVLNPTLLSMGRDKELVRITFVSTIVFLVVFVPLVMMFDGSGAAIGHILFNLAWLLGCLGMLFRDSRAKSTT